MVMKSGNCKRSEIVRERTTGRTFLQFLTYFKLRISGEGCSSASVVLNRPPSREIFLRRVADIWSWCPHAGKLSSVWPLLLVAESTEFESALYSPLKPVSVLTLSCSQPNVPM